MRLIGAAVVAFGENAEGELYVLTNETRGPFGNTGKIFKLVPTEAMGRVHQAFGPL